MVTMHDVAREAGVSQASVSFAFNKPENLSSEVRERILEVARRLNYAGPNPAARSLRSGRAGTIGLVVNDELSFAVADPAMSQMLQGIGQVDALASIALTILPVPIGGASAEAEGARLVRQAHVDGFLFEAFPESHPAILAADARQLPGVFLGGQAMPLYPSVTIDERAAGYLAAKHILDLGHRNVMILLDRLGRDGAWGPVSAERRHSAQRSATSLRLDGYEDAFRAADLPFENVFILEAGGFSAADAYAGAKALLENFGESTAVIAVSDTMAMAVVDRAHRMGLSVPEDLSVIGFDDIAMADPLGLTTIHQPTALKGQIAAQRLVDAIAGKDVTSEELPVELIVRATTAPPGTSL
ncbi:MAG: LacI family DNA-binding transcriptional regulator [Rhodobacteraceae bacterium]|nr:LacI family DNA-binding transcriptional regulator [Paracoccaceae bacterium]